EIQKREDEKSQFNLFHPTPKRLMRDFNTDRPDKTETPYTVDAGHFQYEADLIHYFYDRAEDGTLSQLWTFNSMNLKVGLIRQMDMQLIVPTYNVLSVSSASSSYRGYADTFLRLKFNLVGNDGGAVAFGVMPFIKFPTSVSGLGLRSYDGGVIFPFALSLPGEWSAGLMFVYSKARDDTDGNYHSEFISSWTLSHALPAHLDGYVEIFSRSSNEAGATWLATFDFGLVYSASKDVKIDAGANVGLTPAAIDYDPFIGLSFRI
ncbi:MAG: transporter, partial [Bdellovibrionia bacterium]